MQEPLDCT